jgi:26 proteasome complex subunit DSS1
VQEFDDFEDEDFQRETDPDQAEYWRSDWDTDDVSDEFSMQLKQELQRKLAAIASQ